MKNKLFIILISILIGCSINDSGNETSIITVQYQTSYQRGGVTEHYFNVFNEDNHVEYIVMINTKRYLSKNPAQKKRVFSEKITIRIERIEPLKYRLLDII